ncbi:MAG: Gfo/Idh/MocA family oxidoreductase [Candidatus Margulisiibacteriota bacterium]
MKKVKLGLVGAGWVAKQHLEVIRVIGEVECVGITSRTKAKAEALARQYEIPLVADDLDALVGQANPDALMILVSEEQMFKVASSAMKYGLPLFVEKPAGLLPEENRKLAELAKQNKIPTMVGFNRRYYSLFHKGLEIIKDHGRLLGVAVEGHERMWRVREGGKFSEYVLDNWIYANSTHTIDLLRFFGGEVKDLKVIAHQIKEKRGDQFAAIAELGSGAIGSYLANWYSPGGWKVVLYGEGVTVEFKPLENGRWIDKTFDTHEIEVDEVDKKFKPGFYRQMEAFSKLVADSKVTWPTLDLNGAYETMRLAEQMSYVK